MDTSNYKLTIQLEDDSDVVTYPETRAELRSDVLRMLDAHKERVASLRIAEVYEGGFFDVIGFQFSGKYGLLGLEGLISYLRIPDFRRYLYEIEQLKTQRGPVL